MMSIGLSTYSVPIACGLMRRGSNGVEKPLDAFGLARVAAGHGLDTIEIPLTGMLPDLSLSTVDRLRDTLKDYGLGLVVDTGVVDPPSLEQILPLAARAGARIVRATLSTILEGARATYPGGWSNHLAEIQARILTVVPTLEAHGLVLALENHQDATSDELVDLCIACGPHIGVTLDVANPLAVAEEPLQFALKVGPYIRNVHLKDYRIYPTSSGYRLVRCPLGDGVIPFPELLQLIEQVAPDAPSHIELAAHYARHIRILEDDWWLGFPPCDVREVLPALRVAASHARPQEESWQTSWERDLTPDACADVELKELDQSISYLRTIGALS
jgi:sugar phosphate isomerase/epimerase